MQHLRPACPSRGALRILSGARWRRAARAGDRREGLPLAVTPVAMKATARARRGCNRATVSRLAALTLGLLLGCGQSARPTPSEQPSVPASEVTEPECEGIRASAQATCPLLAPMVALTEIPSGVRVELDSAALAQSVLAHLRCRIALARSSRDSGGPSCPLDAGGVSARQGSKPETIELVAATPELVTAIRAVALQDFVYTRNSIE